MSNHKPVDIEEVEMNEIALLILENVTNCVNEKGAEYQFIKDLTESPELKYDIGDAQWAVIIDEAFRASYIKAMEDNFLSDEEKSNLNQIKDLQNFYQTSFMKRKDMIPAVQVKQHKTFISKKSPYYMPTPWDYPSLQLRGY